MCYLNPNSGFFFTCIIGINFKNKGQGILNVKQHFFVHEMYKVNFGKKKKINIAKLLKVKSIVLYKIVSSVHTHVIIRTFCSLNTLSKRMKKKGGITWFRSTKITSTRYISAY